MGEFFLQIDKSLFNFINHSLANPFFDIIMPIITDWNKNPFGWALFGGLWLLMIFKGGKKGRVIAVVLLIVVGISDQVSSQFIKKMIMRARPCHEFGGHAVMEHLRLLVPCGSGYSFPSSHAVNSFSAATFLSLYYRKYSWAFFTFAVVVAFSRVYVGVHFPFDIFVGSIVGCVCGLTGQYALQKAGKLHPMLEISTLPE